MSNAKIRSSETPPNVSSVAEPPPGDEPSALDAAPEGRPPAQMNALLPLALMVALLLLVIAYGAFTSGP